MSESGALGMEEEPVFVWMRFDKWTLYQCNAFPNETLEELAALLDNVSEVMDSERNSRVIVGGDFNAKSPAWGSPILNDIRGWLLKDWLNGSEIIVLNTDSKPTFMKGAQRSHIDLTLGTESIAPEVSGWRVLDEENLSGHPCIICNVGNRRMEGNDEDG